MVDFLLSELNRGRLEILEAVQPMFVPGGHLYKEVFGDLKNELYKVM